MLVGESGAQWPDRLQRHPHRHHAVITPDVDDHPRDRRMNVHMLVRVHMIEPQASRAKRLELRAYLHGELTAKPRQKKEPDAGTSHVPVEPSFFADQTGDFGWRQNGKPVDKIEVQPHGEIRQAPRPSHRIARSRAPDHQAGSCQNAVSMSFLDGVVDGGVEPEIVRADDQAFQLAISRPRRN